MGKKDKKPDFIQFVRNKKLPILTLDNRWHELFPEENKSKLILELEHKVNHLLKKQGRLVNGIKDMKELKTNLLKDIIVNMDTGKEPVRKAKDIRLDRNKHYVNEINSKTELAMEELAELPYQIKQVNEELMAESIRLLYEQMEENREELEEVTEWINDIREELKQKILIKQDLEAKNTLIYTYMHDILGPEIMEMVDKEQNKR
jgi:hypothetical protein